MKIMNESVGTRLRLAREKRQLGFEQASEATKIRLHYLQALENDDLSAIPSAAQARGFLRIYSEFLGLQVADLVPAAPMPAPASISPSAEPVTKPKASDTIKAAADSSESPRSGILDYVRGLLKRSGSHATMQSEGPQDGADEPAPVEIKPEPLDKKKVQLRK